MKEKIIWIIDNDPIYQIIAKKIIQKVAHNSNISSFLNGKDAMDQISIIVKNDLAYPDIILLDINMPVMDGWEFLEALDLLLMSKFDKKISIYIVSSSIAKEDMNKTIKYPEVIAYWSKPITSHNLAQILL